MSNEEIQVIVPAGMFGPSDFDSVLDKTLREIAVAACDPNGDDWFPMGTPERNAAKYGVEFENDVFLMHPDYQDAECTCGHHDKADKWHEANPHAAECYNTLRHARFEEWEQAHPEAEYKIRQSAREQICRDLCLGFSIPWDDGKGSYIHCTCGQEARCKQWFTENDHDARCPIALPNFWFKPTDLKVEWYKYIGRDVQLNREIGTDELVMIHEQCRASLNVPA